MPKINVYLPDDLAEQVKQRDVPVSTICQKALREEIRRMQTIEQTEDIQVFSEDQKDGDVFRWPGYDPRKPHLVYGRHPEHGDGWILDYEEGEQPGDNPNDHFIPGSRVDVARALEQARSWLKLVRGSMEEITVEVGDPSLTVGFVGRWLVAPDPDLRGGTRTGEEGYDSGAYWGVALTNRGRIAVYTAHCNDRWAPDLRDYDSLDDAANDRVPADIIAMAASELGEERVIWRDI